MTANTRARDPRVEDYVAQCEQHFYDLPSDVQRSLADDVREIVSEVASQLDGNPADLVGQPRAFCAELRAASGYAPTAEQLNSALDDNAGLFSTLRDAISETAWPATRDFAKELRPAWWLVRGLGFALVFDADHLRNDFHLFPQIQGSTILWLLVAIASVVTSIGFGRGTFITRRRSRMVAVWVMSAIAIGSLAHEVGSIDHLGQATSSRAFVATDPGNPFLSDAVVEDLVEDLVDVEVVRLSDGQVIFSGHDQPQVILQELHVISASQAAEGKHLISFPNSGLPPQLVDTLDAAIDIVQAHYFGEVVPTG